MNPTVMSSILRKTTPASVVIRPAQPNDVDAIIAMHQRLSDESLYKRYLRPRQPTRSELATFCEQDDKRGHTLVALLPGNHAEIVGMAFYVATSTDAAEAAFLVEDQFQGQGIGSQLMTTLVQQAVSRGILYFDATVLPTNLTMIHLLHRAGTQIHNRLGYGEREIRVQLPGNN